MEGPKRVSVKEIAETVQRSLNNVDIVYDEGRSGDYKGKIVSSEKAQRDLEWVPKVDIEDGIGKYIEWFKRQH